MKLKQWVRLIRLTHWVCFLERVSREDKERFDFVYICQLPDCGGIYRIFLLYVKWFVSVYGRAIQRGKGA